MKLLPQQIGGRLKDYKPPKQVSTGRRHTTSTPAAKLPANSIALFVSSVILNFLVSTIERSNATLQVETQVNQRPLAAPIYSAAHLPLTIKDPVVWSAESLYGRNAQQLPKPIAGVERFKRSPSQTSGGDNKQQSVDACQSKLEVLNPYYATNSRGQLRTIVNSELIQQAVQVETCLRSANSNRARCSAQLDCGCEQKYKWHRLLALDPNEPTKGVNMDWFLFPSNCVCRCKTRQHFLKTTFQRFADN